MIKHVSYLLLISFTLGISCTEDSSSDSSSTKENALKYEGDAYALSKGLEEVFKLDDNHSSSQINITDGEFYSTQIVISGNLNPIWRARNASVWLYVDMYAPGSAGLTTGIYEFQPNDTDEDDPALAELHFFSEGKLALDLNKDGAIESDDNEFLKITGGSIRVEVLGDDYLIDFNFSLENNTAVSGFFGADFVQV